MKCRIKFRKYGPVRFIGHLDVMRYFQKAIRRAEIDVAYTSGFSPHQVMSFASPLGVGLESNGEYMDIELNSFTSEQDIMERLNRAGVEGIEVVGVRRLPEGAGNAMASVAAAEYTVVFRRGREPGFDWEKALPVFTGREHIMVMKQTKKGSREMDLRPGIFRLWCVDGVLHMIVDASSAGNIKPAQVVEALLADQGETLRENALLITRQETYANAGTEQAPRLVPLDEAEQQTGQNREGD